MKRFLMLVVVITLVATLLAGCAKPVVEEPVKPREPKILRLVQDTQGATGNHHVSALAVDNGVIGWYVDGLYGFVPTPDRTAASLSPMLAAGDPTNPAGDGKTWLLPLHPEAKWSNGEPINADTYMYSWKMQLDPIMVNQGGMSMANRHVEIANAAAYFNQGSSKTVAWEDVGIKKIGDYTIEVSLAKDYSKYDVMRHFSWVASAPVYEPLYEANMNAERTATQYGTSLESTMSSGRFMLTSWTVGAERVFDKNPYHPLADRIHLDQVIYYVVENAGTRIQMFENGELDYITVPATEQDAYAEDPRILPVSSRFVYMIEMNQDHPDLPLDNLNLRKALYYAVDRGTLAKLGNAYPAPYLISNTVVAYADGTTFRDVADAAGYIPPNNGYNPQLAKEYFDRAMEEEGLSKLSLTINYNSASVIYVLMVEFLQESLPEIFGRDRFSLELNGGPSAQMLDVMKSVTTNPRAYELSLSGWARVVTDYNAAATFEVWVSNYGRRNSNYRSDVIDRIFAESRTDAARKDERRLVELSMTGEKAFIDEVLAVPTLQNKSMVLVAERVQVGLENYSIGAGYSLQFADIITD